jgi:hypothetical protein
LRRDHQQSSHHLLRNGFDFALLALFQLIQAAILGMREFLPLLSLLQPKTPDAPLTKDFPSNHFHFFASLSEWSWQLSDGFPV